MGLAKWAPQSLLVMLAMLRNQTGVLLGDAGDADWGKGWAHLACAVVHIAG